MLQLLLVEWNLHVYSDCLWAAKNGLNRRWLRFFTVEAKIVQALASGTQPNCPYKEVHACMVYGYRWFFKAGFTVKSLYTYYKASSLRNCHCKINSVSHNYSNISYNSIIHTLGYNCKPQLFRQKIGLSNYCSIQLHNLSSQSQPTPPNYVSCSFS